MNHLQLFKEEETMAVEKAKATESTTQVLIKGDTRGSNVVGCNGTRCAQCPEQSNCHFNGAAIVHAV